MPENPLISFNDLPRGSIAEIARRLEIPYSSARLRLLQGDTPAWDIARIVIQEFAAQLGRLTQSLGESDTIAEEPPDVH